MLWPWRDTRAPVLYALVFCSLLLGIAGARGKPSINLYVVSREGSVDAGGAFEGQGVLDRSALAPAGATEDVTSTLPLASAPVPILTPMPTDAGALQELDSGVTALAAAVDPAEQAAFATLEQDGGGIRPVEMLNGYDVMEWQSITGIGPTLAARIVEYRELVGGFESVEELLEVSGIGPAKLSQVEQHLQHLFGW